ncbi:serine/threonine protein kinase, partial [Candidatus Poribacteria bacterium]|nr:serine/threonine protein kinase [Candidatus Poribacteria bacterium]
MPPGLEAKSVLGRGAMGKVYKAWQPKLKRFVAVKTCNIAESTEKGQDPGRLEDEALTIARLNHPNIVSLYDVYRDDEAIYLIMELLEGVPVSKLISSKYPLAKLGPLGELIDPGPVRVLKNEWVCEVGMAVARALDYAHGRDVLHRDVKPGNIHITDNRHVKLLDFSSARDVQQDMRRTTTGTVFGTV